MVAAPSMGVIYTLLLALVALNCQGKHLRDYVRRNGLQHHRPIQPYRWDGYSGGPNDELLPLKHDVPNSLEHGVQPDIMEPKYNGYVSDSFEQWVNERVATVDDPGNYDDLADDVYDNLFSGRRDELGDELISISSPRKYKIEWVDDDSSEIESDEDLHQDSAEQSEEPYPSSEELYLQQPSTDGHSTNADGWQTPGQYTDDFSEDSSSEEWFEDSSIEQDMLAPELDLIRRFEDMLDNGGYQGGSIGVVRNGRLVVAHGTGSIGDRRMYANTLMPISSLSKIFTAVAVLQLVQKGDLQPNATVFGASGLLKSLPARHHSPTDRRVLDITVEHLLRHSGGWDETVGPVYDPMVNKFLLTRSEEVVNIAIALNRHTNVNQYDIIKFMIGQPLNFEPGTKYRYSNFGYSVLGRVIEQVSGMPYEEYVAKHILKPSGMIHTHIGRKHNLDNDNLADTDTYIVWDSQALHRVISPAVLDSTLGWYSNVYDLHRFFKCLLNSAGSQCALLSPEYVQYMTARGPHSNSHHEDTWRGVSLHGSAEGGLWQDSDINDNDVIFFHQGPSLLPLMPTFLPYYHNANVTVIALLTDNHERRLKMTMERFAMLAQDWPDTIRDKAVDELCMAELVQDDQDVLVNYALSEHHIEAYLNALQIHGYFPTWIHGHTWLGISDFVIISRRARSTSELDFKFVFDKNVSLFNSCVAVFEANGYAVDLLQSYKSFSHNGAVVYLAILKSKTLVSPSLWKVNVPIEDFDGGIATLESQGYTLSVKSVEQLGERQYVSYVMVLGADSLTYHDLTQSELEVLMRSTSTQQYTLNYLDTYLDQGQPMYAAVFLHGDLYRWVLQTEITEADLADQAVVWHKQGYVPTRIVAVELPDDSLRYTGLWIKPFDSDEPLK